MSEQYIYTYSHYFEEMSLVQLEQRALFGTSNDQNIIFSSRPINPSRSPFIRERIDVIEKASSADELIQKLSNYKTNNLTYRVDCLNKIAFGNTAKIPYKERRKIERDIALVIDGEPDLSNPQVSYGVLQVNDEFYFGTYIPSEATWNLHIQKPQNFSTALSTRVARAIANIAAPKIENIRIIDPCCGIGTVIIEALSMGMNIVGRDISPFVCIGARKNIAHFGYDTTITKGPIQEVTEHYDVAIIDLPYNVFTTASKDDQNDIIKHARRIANKCVFVTIENIDDLIINAGFQIVDKGLAIKQSFQREILVCE